MRNPLESEEVAFRFVIGTLVYIAPIVVAAWISTWLGIIVFVLMSVLAVVVLRRETTPEPKIASTGRADVADTHRILVITDSATLGAALRGEIARLTASVTEDVLLICALPASTASRESGGDAGPSEADLLETGLQELRAAGINARGAVSRADPLAALDATLAGFDADAVVISVGAADGAELAAALRARFDGAVSVV